MADLTAGACLRAAVIAGAFSGAPSTAHAVLTGRSPFAAARAAGALLGGQGLVRGLLAHAAITVFWTAILAAMLPAGRRAETGALAGLAIAALDLGLVGRRIPDIRALPVLPQLADHIAFGVLVGATLDAEAAG